MSNTGDATADLSHVRLTLRALATRLHDTTLTPEERAAIHEWVAKQRQIVEEIDAVLQVKTPTVEDRLREILDNPEWAPRGWYVLTRAADPHQSEYLPTMPYFVQGERIPEILDGPQAGGIAHIYQVNADGTLTQKR